jgi:hypothetical protein
MPWVSPTSCGRTVELADVHPPLGSVLDTQPPAVARRDALLLQPLDDGAHARGVVRSEDNAERQIGAGPRRLVRKGLENLAHRVIERAVRVCFRWPDGVGTSPAVRLPPRALLHDVGATDEFHAESIPVLLCVLDRKGEEGGLAREVRLICSADVSALSWHLTRRVGQSTRHSHGGG